MGKADNGLRADFVTHIIGPHWQAIETGSTGRGIPDLNGCQHGVEVWVEMKATEHWAVDIDPTQVGWLLRRTRAGGRCFVAVKRKGVELWLLRPEAARTLATPRLGLRDVEAGLILGQWAGGIRNWPWGEVRALLFPDIP